MRHVPVLVAVRVAFAAELLSEQPVAVPPVEIAYVTAPVPDPPVVEKAGWAE